MYQPVSAKRRLVPVPTALSAPRLVAEPLCGCACVVIGITCLVILFLAVVASLNA